MNRVALFALVGVVVIGAGIYGLMAPESKGPQVHVVGDKPIAAAEGSLAAYVKRPQPTMLPAFTFVDGAGAMKDVNAFKGKVTLLNLWATWCAPCRKEMPELAQLQKDLGGADFQVVELSQDLKGYAASAKFLKDVGADNLALYADEKAAALDALRAPGLPVTLLLNRDGEEVGRLLGPAPWAGAEAKAIIKAAIDGK